MRIFLLLFMGFWLLLMVGFTGLYDSHRMAVAYRHYFDHKTEETQREVEVAHQLDRRDIIVYEIFMTAILAVAMYGFIRAGKKKAP